MEGTNSQRAAPGYDAVAQCAVIMLFPQPSRHSHNPSRHSHNPSRHSREGGNLSPHGRRASIGPQHALADERARRRS